MAEVSPTTPASPVEPTLEPVDESSAFRKIPTLEDRSSEAPLAAVFAKADPNADAVWESEQLGEVINSQLKALGKAFAAADWSTEGLSPIVSEGALSNSLRPTTTEAYRDKSLTVARQAVTDGTLDDLRAQLVALRAPFAADGEVRVKFKVVGVTPAKDDGLARSSAILEIVGDGAKEASRINQSARWETRWRVAGDTVLLEEIRASEFEEVTASGPMFVEATSGLLGHEKSYTEQLIHGADYWYGNLDVAFGIHQGNQGVAIADADGDGREDLFICQPAGLPSRLYLRMPDGRLRDATMESGIDWLDNARSALFADLDNDGDQDLVITLSYSVVVFNNLGGAKFSEAAMVEIHSWPASMAATDYDLDGDLDLFVCGYNPRGETAPGDIFANPVPYHDANNGARNFFLENGGGMQFEDVTKRVGLSQNNNRFSFAASWDDYDNDGDPDLYVANDFGRNSLYRNDLDENGARMFRDVAPEAGVEDIAAGMSVSWGDFDRDGWMDIYTSNMFSAAGNRITEQGIFKPKLDQGTRSDIRRHARGNTLYRNKGDGTFEDVSEACGVTIGRWAWGSRFADINNDGNEDIYVANGFFSTPDSGDL